MYSLLIKSFVFAIVLLLGSANVFADSADQEGRLNSQVISENTININQASAADIAKHLKGVGIKRAQDIVAWREKHGPFVHVEQLAEVKGVGDKTVAVNKQRITL